MMLVGGLDIIHDNATKGADRTEEVCLLCVQCPSVTVEEG